MTQLDTGRSPSAGLRPFLDRPERATLRATTLRTPIGELFLVGDGHLLTQLDLPVHDGHERVDHGRLPRSGTSLAAATQVLEYFAGERQDFDLDLAPSGTPFQLRVWAALVEIAYATTASYGEIAERIGSPRAARAVGMANNRNPIALVIPCHRVIGANGSLVGYGGGLDTKSYLLELERTSAPGPLSLSTGRSAAPRRASSR